MIAIHQTPALNDWLQVEINYHIPQQAPHVGFLRIFIEPEDHAWLNELRTNGNHLRKGIASKMLEVAIEYARQCGCRFIALTVHTHNFAAIRVYEKYGFVKNTEDRFLLTQEMVLDL